MASPDQQSSSSNGNNELGHPEELREISFSSEPSTPLRFPSTTTHPFTSSVGLSESNLGSQHGAISRSTMEEWLHESPREGPWSHLHAGGIEKRGPRPPTPDPSPRSAGQTISGGNGGGDGPRCGRCDARVCIE